MANSSALNKLYFDILVSKNKLPLLQTYYSNIKNEILTDLTDLYNYVLSAQAWVDSQITYLNNTRTTQATATNKFIASSSDSLITSHAKYLEMMELYNRYVTEFYSRIHSLENEGVSNSYTVDNFNKNEIGQISSYWKFHYVTRYDDATTVEHKFCALNITSESDLLELSNNRYLYITNENVVYDVDYNTKDVYINYLDKYIIPNISDDSKFHTIFSLADKNSVFAFVVKNKLSSTEINELADMQIIGDKTDSSGVYSMVIFEYNNSDHEFNEMSGNTSIFYITGAVLDSGNKMKVVNANALNDFYYVYIDRYVIRFKIDGATDSDTAVYVQTYSNSICKIEYFKGYFILPLISGSNLTRIAAVKQTSSGLLDSTISASVTLNSFGETEKDSYGNSKYNTDNQIVDIFLSTNIGGSGNSAIYVVTNTNIWYFDTIVDNATINVQRDMRKTNVGITDYSFLDNKGSYLIDEFGYFYVLKDNTYIYCAKTDNTGVTLYGNVVQAPTRYADRLLNLKNIISEDKTGYAYNVSENITKSQLGDEGNENFIYAFIYKPESDDNEVLYCITETGKIAYCDIVTGEWNFNDAIGYCLSSFTGNKIITAICSGSTDDEIFVALANYNILKITFSEIAKGNGSDFSTSNKIYNTSSGSKINAMVYLSAYKTLYLGDNSGYVSALDLSDNTYHTADVTSKDYNETDKSSYAITKGDNAIGTAAITCLTTDGANLIVMGAYGRVASCSLSTFKWTPYNIATDDIPQYDSNIFFNGQYTDVNNIVHTCSDIQCFINYNNTKLVVFTTVGEAYSCNLATGVWSDCVGKIVLHNGSGFGPEIYNDGSILGNKSPKHVIRVGTTAFVLGESGRLASINIPTGGITDYKGTSATSVTGPNYSYTGEDIPESSVLNFALSDNRGTLYLIGSGNIVLSYTIESNEVLIPTNNKLYYIARRQTKYDYLSSLLVRVTKGELSEKMPFYPPSEDNDIYGIYFQSSAYVFKNGKNVWRLSATLDTAYYSTDEGISYTTIATLNNSDILPTASTSSELAAYEPVTSMPQGIVDEKGRFSLLLNIGSTAFTFLLKSDDANKLTWYKLPKIYSQSELDTAKKLNDEHVGIKISDGTYDIIRIVDNSVVVNNYSDIAKFYDINSEILFTINNDTLYYTDKSDNIALISDVISELNTYINSVLGVNSTTLVIEDIYAGSNNNYTFVCNINYNRLCFITLHFTTLSSGISSDNFRIYHKELSLNNSSNISAICIKTNDTGTKGYISVNHVDNTSELFSLNTELYGEYAIHNFKILNVFNSKLRIVDYDPEISKVIIALYNTSDNGGLITHTNSIQSYTNYDSIENSPIRALTEPWKTCQLTLGNGSNESTPNAVMIRLKFRNNPDDLEQEVTSERLTLRYRVLITNVTDGNFVLYEIEKSVGSAKTDDDTGTVEPLVRVIAIDGFEDSIFELFTSKLDKAHIVTYNASDDNYSFDFLTYIQRFSGSDNAVYQIKINPVNTLSADIDAKFFIEPYYQGVNDNITFKNSVNLSEYKTGESYKIPNAMLRYAGILKSNINNSEALIHPVSANIHHKIQVEHDLNNYKISADTYLSILRFDGNGLYDKFSCVLMLVDGKYVIVPLSKNKKDYKYIFDADSSDIIDSYTDYTKVAIESGRTLHKMHNRSVFSKNVVNNPDYYVDYQNKGRIVSVEGNLVNRNGLFEVISSNDGNQKRIRQLSEIRDGTIWRNANSTLDIIKPRELGYGYDIIDRYSVFEAPYNAISAWWVPAKGYILRGNERLLNFTYNDAAKNGIGKKYDRLDSIENINSISNKKYVGGTSPLDNGLTSAANGATNTSETVEAYTEMIDEKFPLENWKGFEWAKMCFIRKWRKVFIDKHIEYYYEVESPAKVTVADDGTVTLGNSVIVTFNSIPYTSEEFEKTEVVNLLNAITPSVNKQLYFYTDICDTANAKRDAYEGIGEETWRRATAWYYKSHSWKVILSEVIGLNHGTIFGDDDTANTYKEDRNLARISQKDFEAFLTAPIIKTVWWVSDSTNSVNTDNRYIDHDDKLYELDNGQSVPNFLIGNTSAEAVELSTKFPISTNADGNVIGEHIASISVPTVFDVAKFEALPAYKSYANGSVLEKAVNKYKAAKLGVYSKTFDTNDLENAYAQINATSFDNIAEDTAYEFGSVKTSDVNVAYVNNTITSLTTVLNSVSKTVSSKAINTKTNSTDNTWNYAYGTGLVIPSYLTNGRIIHDIDTTEHTISIIVREYSSIEKSETNKNKGWFINYKDMTYTVSVKANADGSLNVTSSDSNRVIVTASTSKAIVDGYCGSGSMYYLRKLPITLTIKNLIKGDGYTSVSKDFILWSYQKATISSATSAAVNELLESTDSTFNLYKRVTSEMYSSTYSFLTLDKNQSLCNLTDNTSVVERVFVKQFFKNEKTTARDITWSEYLTKYSKTLSTFEKRTSNAYPQVYNYLEFTNNLPTDAVLKSDEISSAHCWVKLEEGTVDSPNVKCTGTDVTKFIASGIFYYEWIDGTIKRITFGFDDGITLQDLKDKGFIDIIDSDNSVNTVTKHTDDDYFDKVWKVPVKGVSISSTSYTGSVSSVTMVSVDVLEYAETYSTIGNKTSAAKVSTWSEDSDSVSGTGLSNTSSAENTTCNVSFILTNASAYTNPSSTKAITSDTANYKEAYNVVIKAADGYVLPETPNQIQVGTTGTIDNYKYDRAYYDSNTYIYNTDKTVNDILDSLTVSEDTPSLRFDGYSLDGKNLITDSQKTTKLLANTYITIYRLYTKLTEARLIIPAGIITDKVSITITSVSAS